MKIAIIGSRNYTDYKKLESVLDEFFSNIENFSIISGGAHGVDTLAKIWSQKNNIKYKEIKPDYLRYKRAAPLIRNKDIVFEADNIIAFWDGKSRGTKFTIDYAKKINKKVIIIDVEI